jgi:hypothetical protein
MKRAALCAAIVTMALVLLPRASAAQTNTEPGPPAGDSDSEAIWLLYDSKPPPGCPSQAEFEAEVVKLTSKARFTKQRPARRVRIELHSGGQGVTGRLINGDGKYQSSRELRGKDCKEVSLALAIAVALTIDPAALGLGEAEPTPTPPPETKPPKPPPAATKPKPLPAARPKPPSPPRAQPTKLVWGLAAGLTLENAWAPQMHPGGHLFGVFGVGERLRVSLGLTRFLTREVDDLSFGAWMADGSLSVNLAVLGVLRPFAGIGYEIGAVDAAGTGLPSRVQAQRPWQAASIGLGLRFETDALFFQLGGCLLVPFSRQRYLVSDPLGEVRTLYEVPRIGLKQETSLGVFL